MKIAGRELAPASILRPAVVWTSGTRAPFHVEGGKGTTSKVVKFQLRPDPLAR